MPKKVNPELRARAVRMVQEHQQDYPSPCGSRDPAIFVSDQVRAYHGMGLQARHGQPGEVRAFKVIKDRIKWNHDRQRPERSERCTTGRLAPCCIWQYQYSG